MLGLPDGVTACRSFLASRLIELPQGSPSDGPSEETIDRKLSGHLRHVVGVDRVGQAEALKSSGADIVVRDLAELSPVAVIPPTP